METKNDARLRRLAVSAVFFAVGIVLPFVTGQIPQIGRMLLPMHLPVFLCAMICGWGWGMAVGALLPLTRSLLFGAPVFYPSAVCMAVELWMYAGVSGLLYQAAPKKNALAVYSALLPAMLFGRILWGQTQYWCLGFQGTKLTLEAFWTRGFAEGFPGIVLQLIAIPMLMSAYRRLGLEKRMNEE